MDGYAVAGNGPWRVVGRVLAGRTRPLAPLATRTAVEVATGAPVPAGADRVVPYESTERTGDVVRADPGDRRHIRRAGEYARRGQDLAPAGTRVTAMTVGLAASAGLDALPVHARPRVRLIISGDELVHAGLPGWGRVRDAIGPMLGPLLVAYRPGTPPARTAATGRGCPSRLPRRRRGRRRVRRRPARLAAR